MYELFGCYDLTFRCFRILFSKINEKDFIEILQFNLNDSKEYLKKKLQHISNENDLNLIIDHVCVDGKCLIYKFVDTSRYS